MPAHRNCTKSRSGPPADRNRLLRLPQRQPATAGPQRTPTHFPPLARCGIKRIVQSEPGRGAAGSTCIHRTRRQTMNVTEAKVGALPCCVNVTGDAGREHPRQHASSSASAPSNPLNLSYNRFPGRQLLTDLWTAPYDYWSHSTQQQCPRLPPENQKYLPTPHAVLRRRPRRLHILRPSHKRVLLPHEPQAQVLQGVVPQVSPHLWMRGAGPRRQGSIVLSRRREVPD